MKAIILGSALAAAGLLVGSASGRPLNHKRELITKIVYVTQFVEFNVYVDETGAPYSTSTSIKAGDLVTSALLTSSTSQIALLTSAVPMLSSSSASPEPVSQPTSSAEATPTVIAPSAESTASAIQSTSSSTPTFVILSSPSVTSSTAQDYATVPQASSSVDPVPSSAEPVPSSVKPVPTDTVSGSNFPLGITWDVYTGSSQCKSEAEIASEFSRMKEYKMVRIYGMDCQQIPLAIQNALKNGQKLMGGAYLDASGSGEDLSQVIQAYKSAVDQYAGGSWDVIQLFTVENERVSNGRMTAPQVVDAIGKARAQLRQLGYNGPVSAVETAPAIIANPSICEASDVVTVNIHAFFDPNTKAENAGSFVKGQVERVQSACNNKRVVVTESGWPHQGSPNGEAIPSPDNQRAALQSIREIFSGDMFLFSAFDSGWKANTVSTFNAERFWGVIP